MAHPFEDDGSGLSCDRCTFPPRHGNHAVTPTPAALAQTPEHRDGVTYSPSMDASRLNAQARRVWKFMADGQWHTLPEISAGTGNTPEASVSARIRDFRKPEFGAHEVDTRRLPTGAYEYRLKVRVHVNT